MAGVDLEGDAQQRLLLAMAQSPEAMGQQDQVFMPGGVDFPQGTPMRDIRSQQKPLKPKVNPRLEEIRKLKATLPQSYIDEFNKALVWGNYLGAPNESRGQVPLGPLRGMFPELEQQMIPGSKPLWGMDLNKLSPRARAEYDRRRREFEEARIR